MIKCQCRQLKRCRVDTHSSVLALRIPWTEEPVGLETHLSILCGSKLPKNVCLPQSHPTPAFHPDFLLPNRAGSPGTEPSLVEGRVYSTPAPSPSSPPHRHSLEVDESKRERAKTERYSRRRVSERKGEALRDEEGSSI